MQVEQHAAGKASDGYQDAGRYVGVLAGPGRTDVYKGVERVEQHGEQQHQGEDYDDGGARRHMVETPSGELAAFEVISSALFPLRRKVCERGSGRPYARIDRAQCDDVRGKHDGFDQVARYEPEQRDLREHAERVAASDQRCESRDAARPHARCPVYGGARKLDEEEPDRTRARDYQRRGCESDADKACDPKDGDNPHEHRSALFADKAVFKGKGQQAQGAGALDGELREEGAVPSGLSQVGLEEQRRLKEHEEEQRKCAKEQSIFMFRIVHCAPPYRCVCTLFFIVSRVAFPSFFNFSEGVNYGCEFSGERP